MAHISFKHGLTFRFPLWEKTATNPVPWPPAAPEPAYVAPAAPKTSDFPLTTSKSAA
jgi:hypothetical protein